MNGGEIITRVLQNHGVRFLFTLCGGHISPIFVAAEKAGIRVIDVRHEATAVFAADAMGRLTGVPGVVAVTAGPGLTNTITAVKNAQMAQSPLILIGGAAATLLQGKGALQDIDQISLLKPIVKKAFRVKKVKNIVPVFEEAFQLALEGVPGPVFIECPIDTLYPEKMVRDWYASKSGNQKETLSNKAINWYINRHVEQLFEGKSKINFDLVPQAPDSYRPKATSIKKAKGMIEAAKKPLMIIGSGSLLHPDHARDLAVAVDAMGIPVYLSGMARGLLGQDHPLHIRHKRKEAIKNADLIILAGVSNDFRLDYGNHIGSRKFISINRSRHELYLNKKPTLPIHADPCEFLIELSKNLVIEKPEWLEMLREKDRERNEGIIEQSKGKTKGINPVKLLLRLETLLEERVVLVADGGDFVATASYILKPSEPLLWLDPGAFGTLGVGAGFAIAAALVYPDRPVWILFGDGSAGYGLMEMDTFHRHRLGIVALIGNDACWSQIARDQVEFLGADTAVMLEESDYHQIAEAFGAKGEKVSTIKEFLKAVKNAQNAQKLKQSYIINAIIGKTDFRKGSISV